MLAGVVGEGAYNPARPAVTPRYYGDAAALDEWVETHALPEGGAEQLGFLLSSLEARAAEVVAEASAEDESSSPGPAGSASTMRSLEEDATALALGGDRLHVLTNSADIAAESALHPFEQKLHALFPNAKSLASPDELHEFEQDAMLISVAPVKKLPRLQVRPRRVCFSRAVDTRSRAGQSGQRQKQGTPMAQLGAVG